MLYYGVHPAADVDGNPLPGASQQLAGTPVAGRASESKPAADAMAGGFGGLAGGLTFVLCIYFWFGARFREYSVIKPVSRIHQSRAGRV